MLLKDIPGQEQIKQYFTKVIKENRMPHALMLAGGEGYGKLALAIGLSTYLQCQNKTETDACGECNSCRKSQQLIHPDIYFSFPVIRKNGIVRKITTSNTFMTEFRSFVAAHPFGDLNDWLQSIDGIDAQANINVAECNQIIKNLGLKTYEGQYKIQIVWYADILGKEGNRLLKLIEEPADNTVIILITHNRGAVLNTLRSRCQIISIPPVDDEATISFIQSNFELSHEDQQELAFLSAGNLRKAQVLGQRSELNYSEDLLSWLRVSYKGDPEEVLEFVEKSARSGKQELLNFVDYGLHFFREYLLFLNTQELDKLRLTATEKTVAHKMLKIIDFAKIEQINAEFEKAIGYIKRNLALKPLLMKMTLEINHILRSEVDNFVS